MEWNKKKAASIIRDVCMWVSQIEPFFNENKKMQSVGSELLGKASSIKKLKKDVEGSECSGRN